MDCMWVLYSSAVQTFQLVLGQIDTTTDFLKWCASQDFSLIDLNLHPVVMKDEVCVWTFYLFAILTGQLRIYQAPKHVGGQLKMLLLTLGTI